MMPVPPTHEPEIHHAHRDVTGGWLRAAVFGAMDGLVSNTALIAGVAGGGASPRAISLTAMAGLAAGALSMAAGEFTSVAAQTEMVEAEIAVERAELVERPETEQAELAGLYEARGVDGDLARRVAAQLSRDPEQALRIHAREELGVDLDALPSPTVAAACSFLAFSAGALLPALPYLLGGRALWPAVALALVGLFVCGALVSRLTIRAWWYSGTRQLVLGAVAAGLTYAFGNLVDAALG